MENKYYYMMKAKIYEAYLQENLGDYFMASDAVDEAAHVMGKLEGRNTFMTTSVLVIIATYGGYVVSDLNSSPFQRLLETGLVVAYKGMLYMKEVWE